MFYKGGISSWSSSSQRMVLCRFILLLIFAVTLGVRGQFDSNGFLSIDCGLPANSSYVDSKTNLTYVSDEQFIDTGYTAQISSSSLDSEDKEFQTVRYFPEPTFDGSRNCYTIRSLTVGSRYLIRAIFFYGNYDKKNKPPTFDVYIGLNFWGTVNASTDLLYGESIVEATADYLLVCLVRRYSFSYEEYGVPFISSLHLRQLKEGMYDPYVNSTQLLITRWRYNLGASNHTLIRYPDDKYDRWWSNYTFQSKYDPQLQGWEAISTNSNVAPDPELETPSLVMQTAATTRTTRQPLLLSWSAYDYDSTYCLILHFAEINNTTKTDRREFTISGPKSMLSNQSYVPPLLSSQSIYFNYKNFETYSISLDATSNSTLPPLLNAIEQYEIMPIPAPTYAPDVAAINSIKQHYSITTLGWMADPCLPNPWPRIFCESFENKTTRINDVTLVALGLTGSLSDHFGNLTALDYLYLSNNRLSGSIPDSLGQLNYLNTLDLNRNFLSGPLPQSLGQLKRLIKLGLSKNRFSGSLPESLGQLTSLKELNLSQNSLSGSLPGSLGLLTNLTILDLSQNNFSGTLPGSLGLLRSLKELNLSRNHFTGSLPEALDNTDLTTLDITGTNISAILPPGLRRKVQNSSLTFRYDYGATDPPPSPSREKNVIIAIAAAGSLLIIAVALATALWCKWKKHNGKDNGRSWKIGGEDFPKLESRQFRYNDLKKITDQFKTSIGTGGFGSVYLGLLEDGVQVAVKMHSNTSAQGFKELLAEAESLTRVHHKNLVSLMGYCIDENCMALVYEYMQGGNLYDKLKDDENPLAWKQRLQIACESALGLEYLHKACNPPLIHRDVKTSNILLTATFGAKLADFGLSRAFNNEAIITHVSTRVVGTPGYLDPEYYMSNQLSTKSDVFSFGVVLLELITGRRPIFGGLEGGNLVQWVHQKLSEGDIQSIVDPKMQNEYDLNSVWKVANLACKCTEFSASQRPTMTAVAAELKESLDLEMPEMHTGVTNSIVTDVSLDSQEIPYLSGMTASGPSVR